MTITTELACRTWLRIVERCTRTESGCLLWDGALNSRGYGLIWVGKTSVLVHRVALIAHHGDIPTGHVADHTCHDPHTCGGGTGCHHRRCVEPTHLEPVTSAENSRRGAQQNRAVCKRNHLLTTRRRGGKPVRCCRTCESEARRARKSVAA